MRLLLIPAAAAIILGSGTMSATALTSADRSVVKAAVGDVTLAQSSHHRRPYYHVRVPRYRNQGWVPPQDRGFQDPGFAYHGNINGCVVDLGYGRWESCNVGR